MAAFKLSKEDKNARDNLLEAYRSAAENLRLAAANYARENADLFVQVEDAQQELASVARAIEEWAHDIGAEAEDTLREKSEAWQEGHRGTTVQEWADSYQELRLECPEIELQAIDEPDIVENPLEDLLDEPGMTQ